ncbi:hypothetical protein OQJ13_03375 [Legionella sp. PATHC035]|uniref:hypothetical protein n=1 Tax=Legionella sp. PATHC035 TaxID=2992040 RepID=UPI00224419EC|nr:hypothetical protein [Legionella sp. PATHC035]MCW8408011.1 hypothetical protein [Legionella sp. PATHC035]
MGKSRKEENAFNTAQNMRNILIGQLKRCKSLEELNGFLEKYKEKKIKNPLTINLTEHHRKIISNLDVQINELIQNLKQRYTPQIANEHVSSAHEQGEKADESITEVTTEISSVDSARKSEDKQDAVIEVKQVGSEQSVPFQIQTKASDHGDKRDEADRTQQRISKKVPADEQQKTGPVVKHDKKLQEDQSEVRNRRRRTIQVHDVTVKLKTLHAKYKKYEEKAKLYKKNPDKVTQYKQAAAAAKNIYDQITAFANQFIADGDLQSFKSKSQVFLSNDNEDVKTLKSHRGWWEEFLDDLVKLINKGLVCTGSSIRVGNLSIFKPATDGGKKIDELSNSISAVSLTKPLIS